MTDQDEQRVAKMLQGVDLPADPADLAEYAGSRGANEKIMQALHGLPSREYGSVREILDALPKEPEGGDPGGTARPDVTNSPTTDESV